MAHLLNVDHALEQILARIGICPAETVPLNAALTRILAQEVTARASLPPFASSGMDGFAVRVADVAAAQDAAPSRLRVVEDIPAGTAPQHTLQPGECARIMTGAPVPAGADGIVPVEQTDGRWDVPALPEFIQVFKPVQPGAFIRPAGENIAAGQTVLHAGQPLRAAEVGILAAMGETTVSVLRRPRVAILSSGDELVPPGQPLAAGQIYDANSLLLAGLVQEHGGVPLSFPIARDTVDDIRALFRQALAQQPDMILSSAGVSVGAADFTRTVLDELGEVGFWRINLRPGKPLAFGQLGGVPFFGLPGNPVSAAVTFDVLVRPALLKLAGRPDDAVYDTAIIAERLRSDGRRSYIRVTLHHDNGRLIAHTTGTQSSAALLSMVTADALMIIPEDITEVEAGTRLRVKWLRTPSRA